MKTKRDREGYLMIDHRASPGLPKDFMKNLGFNAPSVGEGEMMECPTLTCCHCGGVVIMNPDRKRARNHCFKCNDYVCDRPECILECKPFSKTLDEQEKQAYQVLATNQSTGFTLRKD